MKRYSHTLSKKEYNIMNRILKISLISVGSVAATALVSSISYIKGKQAGVLLMKKQYEGQLNSTNTERQTSAQPQA